MPFLNFIDVMPFPTLCERCILLIASATRSSWRPKRELVARVIGLSTIFAFSLSSSPSVAATATGTFAVSATVQATCSVAASPLGFGTYTGATITATTILSVTCTNTTPYTIALNAGTATGATVTTRKTTGPSAALINYGLYRDAAWTLNWGITVGTDTVAGTGSGSAQALTVYGQMPAAQLVTPGAYSDTITATINY